MKPGERESLLIEPSAATRGAPVTEAGTRPRAVSEPRTVHQLFERQAERDPHAVALLCGDKQLSYSELSERANRLARHLVAKGVRREVLVAVCLRRSTDLIVALLAILKAGAAYVPLDPDYPFERLAFMLEDTAAPVVVTELVCNAVLPPHANVVLVDRDASVIAEYDSTNLGIETAAENLIYVMYTSGSTGRPKGVLIEHRGVVRLVCDSDYLSFDRSQRFLLLAPISFDASTLEIWGPLLNGGSLAVMPPETPSLEDIARAINGFSVTTLWLPAGLFNLMVDQRPEALARLQQLVTGGDAGSVERFRKLLEVLPDVRLVNGYGPTETTTFAVCLNARREHLGGSSVPIGYPIANTSVWILDPQFNPVPRGASGELYIGGDGVARGYLNQRDLTAGKFVVPKWSPDASMRLYRTGDLARYRDDGAIEFIGRIDDQLKISGYRVEPGEIVSALRQHPSIRDAAVVVETNSVREKHLIAYVVPRSLPAPDQSELRNFLRGKLPRFMVPGTFAVIDEIPLTHNGKIDRDQLLAARERSIGGSAKSYALDHAKRGGSLEDTIAAVWKKVLRLDSLGNNDSFFDLGGDSLQLIEVHSTLQKLIAAKFSITDSFQYPTIAALAAHLNGAAPAGLPSSEFEQRARHQREVLEHRARETAATRDDSR